MASWYERHPVVSDWFRTLQASRQRWLWLLPPLFWMGILFCASSITSPEIPGSVPLSDKGLHFLAYGLLGGLILLAAAAFGLRDRLAVILVIVLVSLYGLSDEWHQSMVPGRSATVSDWVADTLGGLAAACGPWLAKVTVFRD